MSLELMRGPRGGAEVDEVEGAPGERSEGSPPPRRYL